MKSGQRSLESVEDRAIDVGMLPHVYPPISIQESPRRKSCATGLVRQSATGEHVTVSVMKYARKPYSSAHVVQM